MRLLLAVVAVCLMNGSYGQSPACSGSSGHLTRFYQLVNKPYPWIAQKELLEQLAQVLRLATWFMPRINDLRQALHTARWLHCLIAEECIVVNIPAAALQYYVEGRKGLSSRVIVGKPATRTGTLSSKVQEVILYPY